MTTTTLKAKGQVPAVALTQYTGLWDGSTDALKYGTLQQIQTLFDGNLVTTNAYIFSCWYMTEDDVTPAEMIPGWVPYSGDDTVAQGQMVLRNSALNQQYNGLWVIQSGTTAAIRYSKYNAETPIGRSIVMIRYGHFGGNSYRCTNNGVTVGVTNIQYEQIYFVNQALNTDSDPTFDSLILDDLTASELISADSNKKIISLPVATYPSVAELAYLKGVTSAIQTQLNAKQKVAYAEIYLYDGSTAQSIPTGATYTKVTAYTTNGLSSNCTADAGNDKITITETGVNSMLRTFLNGSM